MKKSILFIFIIMNLFILLSGCSSHSFTKSYERVKRASYNAVSDSVTVGAALGASAVYLSGNDTKITNYFMEKQFLSNSFYGDYNRDDVMRTLNGLYVVATALAVSDDGNYTKKLKRVLVEEGALSVARVTTNVIKANTSKVSPNNENNNALASHHALEPFTGAAMIRRNVANIDVNEYAKRAVIGLNYYMVGYSSLLRVQEGGHSFGDQLFNATMGNFLGIFMHDLFLLDENIALNLSMLDKNKEIQINYRF